MQNWFSAHYEFFKDFASPIVSLVGIMAATGLAIAGLRTFETWRRERLEERRIDVALEGLAIARETKYVFGRIRNPQGFEGEWRSMPVRQGESEEERNRRGSSYATLVRLQTDDDFFNRTARFLPKAVALFGDTIESTFERLEFAENLVRDAAVQLTWQIPVRPDKPSQEDFENRMLLRADLWAGFGGEGNDRVEKELVAFRQEAEEFFRNVLKRK